MLQVATIMHEIGHWIGFSHEQKRPDSSAFVYYDEHHIKEGKYVHFSRSSVKFRRTLVPYDMHSIMHYDRVVSTIIINPACRGNMFLIFIIHPCDPTVVTCYLIRPCDTAVSITYLISHSSSLTCNLKCIPRVLGYFC